MIYQRWGKRLFDLLISACLLILLLPVFLLVGIGVRLALGAPVFFRQDRPGVNGILFSFIKFRSMSNAVDQEGRPFPDEQRLGRFGRFLRSSSLDEIPELWNVFRGEMSLVGPRPLLPAYVARYNAFEARRMEVRPGITGWAQVNGRNTVEWEKRFEMDVWYVDHVSFRLDLKILSLTLIRVFQRDGINAEGQATMAEFRGSGPGPTQNPSNEN